MKDQADFMCITHNTLIICCLGLTEINRHGIRDDIISCGDYNNMQY